MLIEGANTVHIRWEENTFAEVYIKQYFCHDHVPLLAQTTTKLQWRLDEMLPIDKQWDKVHSIVAGLPPFCGSHHSLEDRRSVWEICTC